MDTRSEDAGELAASVARALADFNAAMGRREAALDRVERRTTFIVRAAAVGMLLLLLAMAGMIYLATGALRGAVQDVRGQVASDLAGVGDKIESYYGLLQRNAATLDQTLRNVEAITATFAGNAEFLDTGIKASARSLENVARLTDEIPPLVAHLNNSLAAVEAITGSLVQTVQTLNKTSDTAIGILADNQAQVQQITRATATAADELGKVLAEVGRGVKDLSGDTIPRINDLVSEIQGLVRTLNSVALDLQQDPRRFILGRPKPGPGE